MSTDELFASLGGSLMKDLWADLEVDGDDGIGFSLEQLERELAHLDETPGANDKMRQTIPVTSPILETTFAPPGGGQTMSTASYIVSHQNIEGATATFSASSQIAKPTTGDAWQESLQKFSSMSGLEHDFLKADSARKKPKPPPGFLDRAEDYDCTLTTAPIVVTPVLATPLIAVPLKKSVPSGNLPSKITAAASGPPPGMKPLAVSHATSPPPGILPNAPSSSDVASPPPGLLPFGASPSNGALLPPGQLPVTTSSFEMVSKLLKKSDDRTHPPPPGLSLLPEMQPVVFKCKTLPQSITPISRISSKVCSLLPPLQNAENSAIVSNEILNEEKETEKSQKAASSAVLLESSERDESMNSTQSDKVSETPLKVDYSKNRLSGNASLEQVNAELNISQHQISARERHEKPSSSSNGSKLSLNLHRPKLSQSRSNKLPAAIHLPPAEPIERGMPRYSSVETLNVKNLTNPQAPPKELTQTQPFRVYCQVHPSAPPIPASVLESKHMSGRDLAYVLHSMLKPVLLRGFLAGDYDLQLLQRRTSEPHQNHQQQQKGKISIDKNEEKTPDEIARSRAKKTMEWMKKENILGHVPKTDVTRPRALLATPKLSLVPSNEDQAQRTLLWKGRLYIDQGQVAATSLMELWRTAPPGTVPPEVQPHLLKLFKVLGMRAHKNSIYSMDVSKNNLTCILKLSKGRMFVSRLLEVALLPPKAVQVLLPVVLHHACKSSHGEDNAATDTRLFGSIMRVVVNLSSKSPEMLLACLKAVSFREALSSQPRMECIHAILRLGHAQQTIDWAEAEADFMKLLS